MGRHRKLTEKEMLIIEDRYCKQGKTAKNVGLSFGLDASGVLKLLVKRGAIPKTTKANPRKYNLE